MAAKKRVDMSDPQSMYAELRSQIEELRLQLSERDEDPEKPKPKADAGLAALGVIHGMQAVFEPLRAAIERDAAKDGEIGKCLASIDKTIQTLIEAVRESLSAHTLLRTSLDEFTRTLRTPKTRTGVVDLPSGSVKMTITEARGKH